MKTVLVAVALIVGAIMFVNQDAIAQPGGCGEYTCVLVNGVKCRVDLDSLGNPIDTLCDPGSSGSGTFTCTATPIPATGPVNTSLQPQSVSVTSNDPVLGVITTSYDNTRPSTNTTIVSNSQNQRYPLTVVINFPATATVSSRPGITYVSRTELSFASTNVNSVNPFVNETLTLQKDVEFYDSNDPQQRTVFRLRAGSTNVTL